jgi:hypothetical protein
LGQVEEDFSPVGFFEFFDLLSSAGAGGNSQKDGQSDDEFHFFYFSFF